MTSSAWGGPSGPTKHSVKSFSIRFTNSADLYQTIDRLTLMRSEVIVYLAVPPTVFADVIVGLGSTKVRDRVKLLIEKPFETDLSSANALNQLLDEHMARDHVFAVDHFLEKDSFRSVAVLRFENAFFESVWNTHCIESVDVGLSEDLGIGDRAGFFDAIGTLRDVSEGSITDTYVRAELSIHNRHWRGVRWTLRAGKALSRTATEITNTFRQPEGAHVGNERQHRTEHLDHPALA